MRRFVLLVMLWLAAAMPLGARRVQADTAADLNDMALSFIWNDLDSAEMYADMAAKVSGTHSDQHAQAVNTLARIAYIRMDYERAWELFTSVQSMTGNQLELLASDIGLMRICQITSDNVAFYECRNSILLRLRALHEEQGTLTEAQNGRLLSLERSFRMESARYYHELEQPLQADREMSFVTADDRLRDDHDRYLMYTYLHGLGIGLVNTSGNAVSQRLRSLDNCLRGSITYDNVRMQGLSISAICRLLLEYGTQNVLSGISGDMLQRLNASDVSNELLPTQLALKSIQLFASYGDQYGMIESQRLLAACHIENGLYSEALDVLSSALSMISDSLSLYREDGVMMEQILMGETPHKAVPECLSAIREQISLAYSGLDNKEASDYNRNIYLELQKTIRLDRRYEARTMLLERSNKRLTALLYGVVGLIALSVLLMLVFRRRIDDSNRRYVELMERTVALCQSILTGDRPVDELDESVRNVLDPYLTAAKRNADELVEQQERLKQAGKQNYLQRMHADEGKRENLARKTCCQVVAECMPYIERMRAEILRLTTLEPGSSQYEQSLEYVRELASCINGYNDVLTKWIKVRQGLVSLHIESVPVQELFDIVAHGSRSFQLKDVNLTVEPTDAIVRADRVLTLFMINTLADNARKFTPAGGQVTVRADQSDEYVEISVTDTGTGLSDEDVRRLTEEKVYDPETIGPADMRDRKGSGFGLMNCRGIIDKYRKTDEMFSVCSFGVTSAPGSGSRFFFRLPKGIRRLVCILVLFALPGMAFAQDEPDFLIMKAYNYAYQAYNCNTMGLYEESLAFADSAFMTLDQDWIEHGGADDMLLSVFDERVPAETFWLEDGYATDYETILWLRNEIAISALALRDWEVYRYNNAAYLKLFKMYFSETLIEEDCRELQRYNSNLSIALILFVTILLVIVLMRYVQHSRHWMRYRSDLQQVMRVVNRISELTVVTDIDSFNIDDVLKRLLDGMFTETDHLFDMRQLMIMLDDDHRIVTASHADGPVDERLVDRMRQCLESGKAQSTKDGLCQALPLVVQRCVGTVGFRLEQEPDETWPMLSGMVASYLASALYSCVLRFQTGVRDIEQIQEESRRIKYEADRLHVSNLVLDNCLSTLKHETVWYPNRIAQMAQNMDSSSAADMLELTDYYREIYGILSQYALSQTKERLVSLQRIPTGAGLYVMADESLLDYLTDTLKKRIGDYSVQADDRFVRFTFHSECRIQDPDNLFSPLSNMDDMSLVLCRQIIREHDEAMGHPGCRINAENEGQAGTVWFTLPKAI